MTVDLPKGIIVEDQPVIWEYAKSCLDGLVDVVACCASTKEAEEAYRKYKPDFVWLDCYLGEVADLGSGLKNSGVMLATWIKKHNPETKVMIFTSSNEASILEIARSVDVEGIALGGKYIRDKQIIIDGVKEVLQGREWVSPNVIEDVELHKMGKVTIFEFCVICSMILGKSTAQIADELDTTRKRINNALYRIKEKLDLEHDIEREELLDILKDKIKDSFDPNEYYKISDIMSIDVMLQKYISPALNKLKEGELHKFKLGWVDTKTPN